jgi:hypothetical protein
LTSRHYTCGPALHRKGKKIGGKKIESIRSYFFAFDFFAIGEVMPISLPFPVRRLTQPEFGEISFEVMRHVFAIHNDLGRFFDEKIYKRELAHRLPHVRLETPMGPWPLRDYAAAL